MLHIHKGHVSFKLYIKLVGIVMAIIVNHNSVSQRTQNMGQGLETEHIIVCAACTLDLHA